MNLIKTYLSKVMVACATIAFMLSCDPAEEQVVEHPDIRLNITVDDITATTAKIKVTHDGESSDTWYGFVTDDTSTDAATLIAAQVAKGITANELHRSKQYITILEALQPETSYRYIAIGVSAEGVTYGEVCAVEFKTLSTGGTTPDDYNGMSANDAWTVMYIGEDEVNGVAYEHVVKVRSTDNNPYAITIVYAEQYDPYQLRDLAEAMLEDMMAYLKEFNATNGTSYKFSDMLYTGSAADPFDLNPGVYRALAIGYTPEGEVSGLYAVSDEFEIKEAMASAAYSAWLGEWNIEGQNHAVTPVVLSKKIANKSFTMTGWEGYDDLAIEVEYNAELDAIFFYSQLVAEDYDLGAEYGKADIYLFAGDEDGYYYDNKDGDYYIAIGGILDDGVRAIVRYGVNVPGYPKFVQMFFMADIDGNFYALTAEDDIPSFIAGMNATQD